MAAPAKSRANLSSKAKSEADPLITDEKLQTLYKAMLRCRALEGRARLLSPSNRFPSPSNAMRGQEAIEVGCAIDLLAADRVASLDRDYIFRFIHGLPLRAAATASAAAPLAKGSLKTGGIAVDARDPFTLGVRLALANRSKRNRGAVVVFSRSDSASRLSWDEMLRIAAARRLPVLFVVRCAPGERPPGAKRRAAAAATEEPSSQSERHGVAGIPVDGSDVVAVYRVAQKSLERARLGGGPTLIECKNWFSGRQTGDPIRRMEEYLLEKGLFSKRWKRQAAGEIARELDAVFPVRAVSPC